MANYLKYRPRYPEALLPLLKDACGLTRTHRIADIGTGAGLLAELFLRNGNPVIGVEPDAEIRAGARQYLDRYPRFELIEGTAEASTLGDGLSISSRPANLFTGSTSSGRAPNSGGSSGPTVGSCWPETSSRPVGRFSWRPCSDFGRPGSSGGSSLFPMRDVRLGRNPSG